MKNVMWLGICLVTFTAFVHLVLPKIVKTKKTPEISKVDQTTPEHRIARNYEEAVEIAAKSKKLIVLYFRTDWCVWCKKMDKETFQDPDLKKNLDENYIFVKIDGDKNKDLVEKFKVEGFPSFRLIHYRDEIVLKDGDGFMDKTTFNRWLVRFEKHIRPAKLQEVDNFVDRFF